MVAFRFCNSHISFVTMFPVTEIVQRWFLTGGLIRAKLSPVDSASRETSENTGLDIIASFRKNMLNQYTPGRILS